jgi:hypothetical protein
MADIGKELETITVTPERLLDPYPTEFPVKPEVDAPAPLVKPELVPA